MKLTFLGGAKTATGSKYLLDTGTHRYLIDCGLFQGYKELRLRNWEPFPVDPNSIDGLLLTHAHIDHSGYIPRVVSQGFQKNIFCTPATYDLCEILLRDSAYLQEEDAKRANKKQYSKHKPALPLYTKEDAEKALKLFKTVEFEQPLSLPGDVQVAFHHAGHILGASFITIKHGDTTLLFSGDVGRLHDPVMEAPDKPPAADYVIIESTYGNRLHETTNPEIQIASIINSTVEKNGIVLIPSFAVGRAQSILYYIDQLKKEKKIPNLPIYIDSPMAINATEFFCEYHSQLRISKAECNVMCNAPTYTRTVEDSKKLNSITTPSIIISASGMATGGRVLHHLKHLMINPVNTILFAGFQAGGTRGDRMMKGEPEIKIHGQMYPVAARVEVLDNASAHADYSELLVWLGSLPKTPKKIFITHGEPKSAEAFKQKIEEQLGWPAEIPEYLQSVNLE